MKFWNKKKTRDKNKNKNKNNRSTLVVAIIFLSAGFIIYRLYCLQIRDNEHYISIASAQHDVYAQIEPKRGKIYIQDYLEDSGKNDLYPLATNKEFALVYAKPNQIKPEETGIVAEKLYEAFDQRRLESRFTNYLEEKKKEIAGEGSSSENATGASTSGASMVPEPDPEIKEALKKEFIEKGKQQIMERYLKILGKTDDPYEPIQKKVDLAAAESIKSMNIPGIDYTTVDYRYYPENNIGAHFLGFVGYSGDEKKGRYGLEEYFNEELSGRSGSIKTERDARGNWIIVNSMDYEKPVDGNDLVLTINRTVQFTACEKLKISVMRHGADMGSIIIMDPYTGAIIAMCSYPDYNPNEYENYYSMKIFNNPTIFSQYEPGSVFKAITMAGAVDQGKVRPDSTYEDKGSIMIKGWPKAIKNSDFETYGGHGRVDMSYVLQYSLNTGAIYAMEKMGAKTFSEYVKKFGFGERTGIELEGEGPGNIKNLKAKNIKEIDAAVASFGQGISVTPLQMINSYAAIANGGILMKPYLVKEVVHTDGTRDITKPIQLRRVMSERTSALITGMLVSVLEKGHTPRARIKGYYVAGKTGTAQVADEAKRGYGSKTIHTFIGIAPADDPKFVMLVKIDNPRDVRFADSSAAPLFSEIGDFLLNYYKVPPERKEEPKK